MSILGLRGKYESVIHVSLKVNTCEFWLTKAFCNLSVIVGMHVYVHDVDERIDGDVAERDAIVACFEFLFFLTSVQVAFTRRCFH